MPFGLPFLISIMARISTMMAASLTSSAEVLRLLLWQSMTHDPESVVSHHMLITLTKAPPRVATTLNSAWDARLEGDLWIVGIYHLVNAESHQRIISKSLWRSLGILESVANFWALPVNRLATDYTTKFLKIIFEGIKRNARPLSWGTSEGWANWDQAKDDVLQEKEGMRASALLSQSQSDSCQPAFSVLEKGESQS